MDSETHTAEELLRLFKGSPNTEFQTPGTEGLPLGWHGRRDVLEKMLGLITLEVQVNRQRSTWIGKLNIDRHEALASVARGVYGVFRPPIRPMSVTTFHRLVESAIADSKFGEEPKLSQWTAVEEMLQTILDLTGEADPREHAPLSASDTATMATLNEGEGSTQEPSYFQPASSHFKRPGDPSEQRFQWRSKETAACLHHVQTGLNVMWNSTRAEVHRSHPVLMLVNEWKTSSSSPGGHLWNLFMFQRGLTDSAATSDFQYLSDLCKQLITSDRDDGTGVFQVWTQVMTVGPLTSHSPAFAQSLLAGLSLLKLIAHSMAASFENVDEARSLSANSSSFHSSAKITNQSESRMNLNSASELLSEMHDALRSVDASLVKSYIEGSLTPYDDEDTSSE